MGGDGADCGAFEVPTLVVLRKMHGGVPFDIDLPLSGLAVGIECRNSGGNHQVIVTVPGPASVSSASVTSGTGSVSNLSVNGPQVIVDLTGVTNAQTIVVTLFGFGGGNDNLSVPMGALLGDTTGIRSVNASDTGRPKRTRVSP